MSDLKLYAAVATQGVVFLGDPRHVVAGNGGSGHMPTSMDQEAFKRFERDGYSRVAEGYAHKTAHVSARAKDAILDAVGVGPGFKALEVACGPGLLSSVALKREASIIGLDFSPEEQGIGRR